jgi:hypothetical protein
MKTPLKVIRALWAKIIPARFWSKVAVLHPARCWDWLGALNENGYGQFRYRGRNARASRIAWWLTYGAIPRGKCVCHECDRRRCVNPAHLFLGTQAENMRDKKRKGRQRGGCRRKLLPDEVRQIRSSRRSLQELASQFGLTPATIRRIKRRHSYSDV